MTIRRTPGRWTLILVLVAGVTTLATPLLADAPKTEKLRKGTPVSIQAYGAQNPDCLEWTNGCVLCESNNGQAECSTPGIACQPAGLTCKRLKGK